MTSFVISTAVDAAQSLTNGETGVITSTGALINFNSSTALTVTGSYILTVDGMLTGDAFGVASSVDSQGRITVGRNGSISADTGISSQSSTSFTVTNNGTISGYTDGIRSSTNFQGPSAAAHDFTLTNTGSISGLSGTAVYASLGNGNARINNSSSIIGDDYGLRIEPLSTGSVVTITNTGTIQTLTPGSDAIFVNGGLPTLTNSGTIVGDVVLSATGTTTKITNSGSITGDISVFGASSGAAIINSGKVTGDITGSTFKDVINLTGGSVTGTVNGGLGNDDYTIGSTAFILTEATNAGYDTVYSSVTWTLGANFDALTLTGNTDISGSGNNLDNSLIGNDGDNILRGRGGADQFRGGDGDDSLIGGAGNDTYYFDPDDIIVEADGGGYDQIVLAFGSTFTTIVMAANVERFTTSGTLLDITVTGNASNNRINTYDGNDTLNGVTGTDTLEGGLGSDTYITDGGDTFIDDGGLDTVQSSATITLASFLEDLTLTGSGNINGTGNSSQNRIIGNSGANSLNGSLGNDTITGGGGNDNFIFNSALGATNIDRITDYNVAADTIRLENAVFTGLAVGTLAAAAYVQNTTGKAVDASDRIIYETDTGKLFFDRDGTGAATAVQFATLSTNLTLTSADFVVF